MAGRRTTEQRKEDALRSIERSREAIAQQTNTHPTNWLTTKEAMAMLGISKPTLIRGRKMRLYKVVYHTNTRFFYDKRSLSKYVSPSTEAV